MASLDVLYAGYDNMVQRVNYVYDRTVVLETNVAENSNKIDVLNIAIAGFTDDCKDLRVGVCGGADAVQWSSMGRSGGCSGHYGALETLSEGPKKPAEGLEEQRRRHRRHRPRAYRAPAETATRSRARSRPS